MGVRAGVVRPLFVVETARRRRRWRCDGAAISPRASPRRGNEPAGASRRLRGRLTANRAEGSPRRGVRLLYRAREGVGPRRRPPPRASRARSVPGGDRRTRRAHAMGVRRRTRSIARGFRPSRGASLALARRESERDLHDEPPVSKLRLTDRIRHANGDVTWFDTPNKAGTLDRRSTCAARTLSLIEQTPKQKTKTKKNSVTCCVLRTVVRMT